MRENHLTYVLVCLCILCQGSPIALAQSYEPPRTEFDHPNLQGVWNFYSRTPLERPERLGTIEFVTDIDQAPPAQTPPVSAGPVSPSVGAYNSFWNEAEVRAHNARTSIIVYPANGRIPPVQVSAPVQYGGDITSDFPIPGTRPVRYTHGGIGRDGPEDRGLSERCLTFFTGPPLLSSYYNNYIQIFQNADHVVILVEMGFDARIVPLSSRPLLSPEIGLWSGDSRGYFEGNTLVVETRNFTTKVASLGLRGVAYGNGGSRLLTERFIPTGPNSLDYEFTIDDPVTFTDKIVGILPMSRANELLYEYACHPGNYALGNILRAARVEEESSGR